MEKEMERLEREEEHKAEQKKKQELLKLRLEEERRLQELREKKTDILHLNSDNNFMKNIFKAVDCIQSECKFIIKKDKIEYRGVDPAHVIMYGITIPKEAIEEYNCRVEHDIGVDVGKVLGILTRRGKGKNQSIMIEEFKEDYRLYFSWQKKYGSYHRKVKNIDTAAMPDSKIPKLNFITTFNANVNEVIEFLKEAEDVSDYLSITSSENGIRFEAIGDEDETSYTIPGKYEQARSLFNIDYFYDAMASMKPFFKEVKMNIGTDNPIEIRGKDKIEMYILIAPRIESE